MQKIIILLLALIFTQISCVKDSEISFPSPDDNLKYPVIVHSHNDYEREIPIHDMLEYGFGSTEVDIAYDGTDLIISHDTKNLSSKNSFEKFYLLPLIEALEQRDKNIILLIDIKNYSRKLLIKLNSILGKHGRFLVARNGKDAPSGRIKVVLSGKIPREEILLDKRNKYLFVDGRPSDLKKGFDSNLMPIISMNFTALSKWQGIGKPNHKTIKDIKKLAESVNRQGKLLRFWKTNDYESVWLLLIALDVDIIAVDNPERFYNVMFENSWID